MLRAHYIGPEQRAGRDLLRFDLKVEGDNAIDRFPVGRRALLVYIVEAELGLPNHMEYKDFRLTFEKSESGGQSAWDALTKSQYANCPAPKPAP